MTDHVQIERSDGVMAILLNRPERRNAITVEMYRALADAISDAATDDDIRLITIRGAGEDFTAGNDLGDFLATPPDGRDESDIPVWRLLRALAVNEVPILAAVQGNAVGIGTTLLFHCDLVVAQEGCKFRMPFVDLGLVPEAASSLLMPRLSGRRAAARHLLLGEPFGAREAVELGLASHVAEQGTLEREFSRIREALLAKPVQALKLTQQLLRMSDQTEVLDRMTLENGHFSERLTSDEVKQAIGAFYASRAKAS